MRGGSMNAHDVSYSSRSWKLYRNGGLGPRRFLSSDDTRTTFKIGVTDTQSGHSKDTPRVDTRI